MGEVAADVTLGLSHFVVNGTIVLLNFASAPLIHDNKIGVKWVFGFLGILSLTGALFVKVFMRHTESLTDIEKKTLYMPEEEKLKLRK